MQGYHTGLPHLLFPSKQHIKHDKRVKQCLKLKTPAGRRAHSMRKNARRLGGTTPCAKTPTSWASALHAQKCPPARLGQHHTQKRPPEAGQHPTQKRPPAGGPTPCAKTPAGRRANTLGLVIRSRRHWDGNFVPVLIDNRLPIDVNILVVAIFRNICRQDASIVPRVAAQEPVNRLAIRRNWELGNIERKRLCRCIGDLTSRALCSIAIDVCIPIRFVEVFAARR